MAAVRPGPAGRQVPEACQLVVAGRGGERAVAATGNGPYLATVVQGRLNRPAGGHLPAADDGVAMAHGQQGVAVGAEGKVPDV